MRTKRFDNPCGYGIDPETTQEDFIRYITELENKVSRRNKQIKNLKEEIKRIREQLYIYGTYTDQIEFTDEDIKKLDKLSQVE